MSAPPEPDSIRHTFATTVAPFASAEKVSAWLLSTFHSAMDGMVIVDAARAIVLLNRETERMFGYPAKCLIGKPLDVLFAILSETDYWPQIHQRLAAEKTDTQAQITLQLRGVRANGEEFPLNAGISTLAIDGERFFALVLRHPASYSHADYTPVLNSTLLRQLGASNQQAYEVERRRFSRELYDDLGQNLSVLKLDLDWLQTSFPAAGALYEGRIEQMQTVLDSIIVRTKSIASALRPPLLDDFGLAPALKWAGERFQKKTGICCALQTGELPARIGEPIESVIFRVVQEGLLNIEKHANASHVNIALWRTEDRLHVLVRDNGCGIAARHKNKPGCFGLLAMQQRIYALSGHITIDNVVPSGLEIHASIPIELVPDAGAVP
jgi:PAS domain S-box-containing protein